MSEVWQGTAGASAGAVTTCALTLNLKPGPWVTTLSSALTFTQKPSSLPPPMGPRPSPHPDQGVSSWRTGLAVWLQGSTCSSGAPSPLSQQVPALTPQGVVRWRPACQQQGLAHGSRWREGICLPYSSTGPSASGLGVSDP